MVLPYITFFSNIKTIKFHPYYLKKNPMLNFRTVLNLFNYSSNLFPDALLQPTYKEACITKKLFVDNKFCKFHFVPIDQGDHLTRIVTINPIEVHLPLVSHVSEMFAIPKIPKVSHANSIRSPILALLIHNTANSGAVPQKVIHRKHLVTRKILL